MVAKNELGQLFVDIGVSGLGKTLKGLNSVSASFLLTKNAAQQMIQPIMNMAKQSGSFALNIDKMSTNLGIATREMQKFHYALKEKGVDESVLNSFKDISDTIFNFQERGIGLTGDMAFALNQLHLNLFDYSSDWKGVSKYIDDVGKKIKDLPIEEQRARLKGLRLPEEMLYYYKQFPGGVSTATDIISDAKLNKLLQLREEQQKSANIIENARNEILSNTSNIIIPALKTTNELVKDIVPFSEKKVNKLDYTSKFIDKHPVATSTTLGMGVGSFFGPIGTVLGGLIAGGSATAIEKFKNQGLPTGFASPLNSSSMTYNNNMVINQTINTNDAMQAAKQSNNLIQETQNNAFQSQVLGEL